MLPELYSFAPKKVQNLALRASANGWKTQFIKPIEWKDCDWIFIFKNSAIQYTMSILCGGKINCRMEWISEGFTEKITMKEFVDATKKSGAVHECED